MMAACPLPTDAGGPAHTLDPLDALLARLGPADRLALLEAALAQAGRVALREAAPSPSRTERMRRRDVAIRIAMSQCWPNAAPSRRAKLLARELARYSSGGWMRERDLAELPAGTSDLRRATHEILKLNGGRALRWRRVLKIAQD